MDNQNKRPVKARITISYRKVSAFQNIRIANQRIRIDKALGKSTPDYYKDELQLNQQLKKKDVALKKQLKKFKANAKAGKKNKGWITRVKNELEHNKREALISGQTIRDFNAPTVTRENGKTTFNHYFDKEDKTVAFMDKLEIAREVDDFLNHGTLEDLESSARLYAYVSKLLIENYGTYSNYKNFYERNKSDIKNVWKD